MAHRPDDIVGVSSGLATTALALARCFASGGTLWCWAPGASQHAQHVAVEFVHPVIVGTRALPAVAVTDDDAVSALRPMAKTGDVLLVIDAVAANAPLASMLRRAEAWGVTTVWLGVGARPAEGAAAHVLWLSEDPAAAYDGRLVLGYHVLWELTHVCFEHPGLLVELAEVDAVEQPPVCTTCSDEGRLGEVMNSDDGDATVRTAQGVETVSTLLVGRVRPGDLVLVHAGTAITVVDA